MSDTGSPYSPRNVQARHNADANAVMQPQKDPWGRPIKQVDTTQNKAPPANKDDQVDNDGGVNDDDIDNIWNDIKKKKEDDNNNPPPNTQVQQEDPNKQISDYLQSVGLDPISLTDQDKEELKEGNFDNFIAKINEKTRNAHLKAMSGSKKMIDAAVADAVKQAMDGANDTFAGRMNLQALHTALPFTKEKAIGPVAQTVMQRMINRGASTEDAIEGVRRFFAKTSELYTNSMVNKNRNTGFSSSRPNSAENGEGGWLDILRG